MNLDARFSRALEDRDLVQACIARSPGAWDDLVERFGPIVHDAAGFTLRRVLGSAQDEDIENVVQGVFVGLCDKEFHRLRLFQGRSSLKTWLTSVTTRFALNYVRTEKRKGSLKFCRLDDSATDLPEREAFAALPLDERERLTAAIEQLPDRDRLLLKLFFFDGLSYKAIGEILKMPVNSISPVLTRAKDALRKLVGAP